MYKQDFWKKLDIIQMLGQSIFGNCLVGMQLHMMVHQRFAMADGKPYKNCMCGVYISFPFKLSLLSKGVVGGERRGLFLVDCTPIQMWGKFFGQNLPIRVPLARFLNQGETKGLSSSSEHELPCESCCSRWLFGTHSSKR